MADEDFEEEEVWSFVKERKDGSPSGSRRAKDHSSSSSASSSSSNSSSKRLPTASRPIPRANANAEENGSRNHKQSAPVNIPDWSKNYRSNASVEETVNDDGDEFDDDGDEQLPPHEWIAKKLARSQISSFSVCEGAGRTLKGRDQRKVRNVVLTKTGFLE